ncbi:dimethyladenosine transferase 2, mitochondrial [Armigeres subalbatus]|uniref:dimethyladenosine transferase 2, mitochondrial n=1 Tax=Armigeres subalbatus TaxID=124917 RepID=UPI002ED59B3E
MLARLPVIVKPSIYLDLRIIRSTYATSTAATPKHNKQNSSKDESTKQSNVSARVAREMKDYFDSDQFDMVMNKFPASLLRRTQVSEQFYLAAPKLAKNIAKWVTDGMGPDQLLVEVNPGVGLLTKELLKKTNNLLLYETDESFAPELEEMLKTENRNVEIRYNDFNCHWKYDFMDKIEQSRRMEKMLEGLRRVRWKDEEVNFRLFSVIGSLRFFKTMVHSVGMQKGLFQLGRCEMYLAVPPLIYMQLTCRTEAGYKLYSRNSVLFQIFFEHELIAKIPRKDFLPWPVNVSGKGKIQTQQLRLNMMGLDELYLMRVVPRRNLFDFCLPDNLKLLMFFVSQNMISRKNRIIPALERWIPYSGARLILNQNYVASSKQLVENHNDSSMIGHNSSPLREYDFPNPLTIFTEFGELTPSQILTMFNEFISWPEYQQSPFLQHSEQYYTKQVHSSKQDVATATAEGSVEGSTMGVSSDKEDLMEEEEASGIADPSETRRIKS